MAHAQCDGVDAAECPSERTVMSETRALASGRMKKGAACCTVRGPACCVHERDWIWTVTTFTYSTFALEASPCNVGLCPDWLWASRC